MISLGDYTSHDGLGLAELVARKEVTPDELVAAAFEATETPFSKTCTSSGPPSPSL